MFVEKGDDGKRTMFHVVTRFAVNIAMFSAIRGECEWVLLPGRPLTITGVSSVVQAFPSFSVHYPPPSSHSLAPLPTTSPRAFSVRALGNRSLAKTPPVLLAT